MDDKERDCNTGFFKNKNVLITGGLGFVGSHLIKRLRALGANLSILSNNSNPWRLKDEINDIDLNNIDITNGSLVNNCVKSVKPDYIFNLAAYGVNSANNEYIKAVNVNIIGIINILNSIRDIGCKKIINIGSSAEYGDKKKSMRENMCLTPLNIYGSTKAAATIISHQIARDNDINIVTLRPFGIFGEGEERHKFFCDVILTLLENKDVELTKCEQFRDYCYVENIIDGLLLAALSDTAKNEVINIGSGISHPLNYYIDLIFKYMETNKKPKYGAIPYRKNEMWNPEPDITKIKVILGWKPRVGLEEGIKRTVEWFKENREHYI
ncbi:MAG TPA: CDP-abequose synthase [Clostridiales bacterium]|nr:MAG: CDP-abequose synthase [Clostridiales bacterium GWD2_32_59]HAN10437.1 CDP-abequose synthase [Clostridiales bacterium]